MEMVAVKGLEIAPLGKHHNRLDFSCGIDSLDQYFHQRAGQDLRKRLAAVYVLHDQEVEKVAGFYTLSSMTIDLSHLPGALQKKLPYYPCVPATLLGRLAVDHAYRKKGYGEILLVDALKRSFAASEEVASYAVVVDAFDQDAEDFYKKYGFLDLSNNDNKNRLFLPMKLISQL